MLHTDQHKPDWLERGPIVVGYDAVRIVRLKSGSVRTEVWKPDRSHWERASLPSDIVLRASPADSNFMETVRLTADDCLIPPR